MQKRSYLGKGAAAISMPLVFRCLLTLSIPQAEERQQSIASIVRSTLDSVVLIVVLGGSGKESRQGSGFLISPDGKILTNYHVIQDASSAVVKLSNGAFFPVDGVLAANKDNDLALIKVTGKNLPSLGLGDSEKLLVGEHVIAIGSPLGLENTVSDGIVSAVREGSTGQKWIQTTAPASPGNSGGPLLNSQGSVIGILAFRVKGGENVNFAVPINTAKPLIASAHEPAPLNIASSSNATRSTTPAGGRIWTSLTTGRDYTVRFDADYVYTDWVNKPSELDRSGGFTRSELKRNGEKWVGKAHSFLPCSKYGQTRWCNIETEVEITRISGSRIEGRGQALTKFNCRKCRVEGVAWKPFTWIPKE